MKLRPLIFLILCNVFWSMHPFFGKILMEDFTPFETSFLRYGSGALTYLIYTFFRPREKPRFAIPLNFKEWLLIIAAGMGAFALSPILQFTGLARAQSIDNAIVIAIEPLFTVFLAWIFLSEKLTVPQVLSFAVAMIGFLMVSHFDLSPGSPFFGFQFMGFFMMMMALWGESAYSVFGRLLTRSHDPVSLFGSAVFIGVISLTLFGFFTHSSFPNLAHLNLRSLLIVLYLGPIGTTFSYIVWMTYLKDLPVASVVITLFVQPIFGSIWGSVALHERFTFIQALGGMVILSAVAFQSYIEVKNSK